jgi:hypothetical protein
MSDRLRHYRTLTHCDGLVHLATTYSMRGVCGRQSADVTDDSPVELGAVDCVICRWHADKIGLDLPAIEG